MQASGRQLSNKTVMLNDAMSVGTMHNVLIDTKHGQLKSILVEPAEPYNDAYISRVPFPQNDDGLFVIPCTKVIAVNDYVVVEE